MDAVFAEQLLADPTLALGEAGCTPQQRRQVRSIQALTLRDFATQAEALFWPTRYALPVEARRLSVAVGT